MAESAATAIVSSNDSTQGKKTARRRARPARVQVDPATLPTSVLPQQTGTVFNLWYGKWSGGQRDDAQASQTHAPSRCCISRDSGYTRADLVQGSFFCLFFARGICPKGQDCEYLHRLPAQKDALIPNIDCFGRDKHSDYRDDMGGVGSFLRQNRTLYIGRIFVDEKIEEIVSKHFLEWGRIERIRVLNARGVAFVTYVTEANAQFAKEAMAHQSLDNDEILNVRWATADPNPVAQAREKRKIDHQAEEAIRRALPAEFLAQIEGRESTSAKRTKHQESYGLVDYEALDTIHSNAGHINPVSYRSQQNINLSDVEEATSILVPGTVAALEGIGQDRLSVSHQRKGYVGPVSQGLVSYESDSDA